MRNNLIMKFSCAECGNYIEFETKEMGTPFWEKVRKINNNKQTDTPTGSECKHSPILVVIPCRYCIKDKTQDADLLVSTIKRMTEK